MTPYQLENDVNAHAYTEIPLFALSSSDCWQSFWISFWSDAIFLRQSDQDSHGRALVIHSFILIALFRLQ